MSKIINIPDPLQMLWNERYCHSSMIGECFGKVHSSTWVNMWRGLLQHRKSLEVWNRRYKSGKFMLTLYWTLMKEDMEPLFWIYILCMIGALLLSGQNYPLMILIWTPWSQALHHLRRPTSCGVNARGANLKSVLERHGSQSPVMIWNFLFGMV